MTREQIHLYLVTGSEMDRGTYILKVIKTLIQSKQLLDL